jgi:hypothetical protein
MSRANTVEVSTSSGSVVDHPGMTTTSSKVRPSVGEKSAAFLSAGSDIGDLLGVVLGVVGSKGTADISDHRGEETVFDGVDSSSEGFKVVTGLECDRLVGEHRTRVDRGIGHLMDHHPGMSARPREELIPGSFDRSGSWKLAR